VVGQEGKWGNAVGWGRPRLSLAGTRIPCGGGDGWAIRVRRISQEREKSGTSIGWFFNTGTGKKEEGKMGKKNGVWRTMGRLGSGKP